MNCGREPEGRNADKLGVCPAAISEARDGVNRGAHGGRFCWAIAKTLCRGDVQATLAEKLHICLACPFLQGVQDQEGREFVLTERDLSRRRPWSLVATPR
jgi:hypothetical protein